MITELVRKLAGKSLEDSPINHKFQMYEYDCGQTCLDMLGYDGHAMFPNKLVSYDEMKSIVGAK